MSVPAFTEFPRKHCIDHGAAYQLFRTEDVPMQGQAFVDLREHHILVDGHREARPAVRFRCFGLTLDREWLGTVECAVAFYPEWIGMRFGHQIELLGESGYLITDYSRELIRKPQETREAVSDLVQAIAAEFFTDLRVAEYRYERASRYSERLTHRDQVMAIRRSAHYQRLHTAKAAEEAAYALLTSLRNQAGTSK
ncbi:hypothetical protein AB0H76_09890 [Nocardia sp. NPDC050712]|uniref:hypothetical protein n=1 Tax=Nocardia sp. NPDC050712 TaxID=3155518 RepID=UPI0033DD87BA